MAEAVSAGRIVEWLRVRQVSVESLDGRRRWTSAAVVSMAPHGVTPRVVTKRAHVPMAGQPAVGANPGGAPAETGDPEPLQALRELPQLVQPERLCGPGDEVLTHLRPMIGPVWRAGLFRLACRKHEAFRRPLHPERR